MANEVKPRVGDMLRSFSNALEAAAELLTIACDKHGGDWEGGRLSGELSATEAQRKCDNSLSRHFLAKLSGKLIDDDPKDGTGCYHDVAVLVNAMMAVERRLRMGKGSSDLCVDEGCPHHGIEHVCVALKCPACDGELLLMHSNEGDFWRCKTCCVDNKAKS